MTRAAPLPSALDAFEAALLSGGIATRVLETWCGGRVHAEVLVGAAAEVGPERRMRLAVGAGDMLGYRRVRLMHGAVVLSEADNWYVPARLSAAMRAALANTDTPFGAVIAPLSPTRRTLGMRRLGDDPILQMAALVVDGDGRPLAEVAETYRRACLER